MKLKFLLAILSLKSLAAVCVLELVMLFVFAKQTTGAEVDTKSGEISYLTPGAELLKRAESIVYKKTPQEELRLYLLRPAKASESPLPAIVYFTGGGWVKGTVDGMIQNAKDCAELGIPFIFDPG